MWIGTPLDYKFSLDRRPSGHRTISGQRPSLDRGSLDRRPSGQEASGQVSLFGQNAPLDWRPFLQDVLSGQESPLDRRPCLEESPTLDRRPSQLEVLSGQYIDRLSRRPSPDRMPSLYGRHCGQEARLIESPSGQEALWTGSPSGLEAASGQEAL